MAYAIIKSRIARKLWIVLKDGHPIVAFTSAHGARKDVARRIQQDAKQENV
jgi:hypothetical protein